MNEPLRLPPDHDQFVEDQVRRLVEQGHSPEEAAAIFLGAQRMILEALQKLLEEGQELAPPP